MWKAGDPSAPPPLHVRMARQDCDWWPMTRPLQGGEGTQPGPALILGGAAEPSLGIDPTDPSTWAGRGYSHSAGMISYLNMPPDGVWPDAVAKGST
jgi:hypothetical protein